MDADLWRAVCAGDRVLCPGCERWAKIYKRRLNSGMASVLVRLFHVSDPKTWSSIEQIFGSRKQDRRDWPLLQHWGLIEPGGRRTATSNASGFWRITARGVMFVVGSTVVPEYVFVWDNRAVRFSAETVTVRAALGSRFDYAELMGVS